MAKANVPWRSASVTPLFAALLLGSIAGGGWLVASSLWAQFVAWFGA